MKCNHCGIHFDDSEKVCPICGARAGSQGRLSGNGRYTQPVHTQKDNAGNDNTSRKYKQMETRDTSATAEKKNRRKIAGIVVAIVIAIDFLAPFIEMGVENIDEFANGFVEAQADENYTNFVNNCQTCVGDWSFTTPNGMEYLLRIGTEGHDEYTLSTNNYKESGFLWYEELEEDDYILEDVYPRDTYHEYAINLYVNSQEYGTLTPELEHYCDNLPAEGMYFIMFVDENHPNEISILNVTQEVSEVFGQDVLLMTRNGMTA